jgi:uncharacterized protein with HEPN domain
MPRDYKVYLEDILEAARRIRLYTSGMSRKEFAGDPKTFDAVVRNLAIVGEAAKKLPQAVRAQSPQVEWRRIAGLRDILIHEYFEIDAEIVWDVIKNKLPPLEKEVTELLAR